MLPLPYAVVLTLYATCIASLYYAADVAFRAAKVNGAPRFWRLFGYTFLLMMVRRATGLMATGPIDTWQKVIDLLINLAVAVMVAVAMHGVFRAKVKRYKESSAVHKEMDKLQGMLAAATQQGIVRAASQ